MASLPATGLAAPWSITFVDGTALVSERDSGRILELGPEGAKRRVGVIEDVYHRGEGGLLGIAVRGEFLYAYFTTSRDNRLVRYPLLGAAGSYRLGRGQLLLEDLPSGGVHNGGRIAFGPDAMLYVTVGDAGRRGLAQDRDSLAGKILRLSPDGSTPSDNPFPGSPVYSLGHRNPQGLAWDDDGRLYASEFGQNTWDELNVIEPGANYGWPEVEGKANRRGFVDPVQQWNPDDASPSGMAFANGSLYIANLKGERVRVIPVDALDTSRELFSGRYGRLRDVVNAPDGSLWVLTNNTDGRGSPRGGDDRIVVTAPDV